MTRKEFFEWLATCPAKEETDETDENGEWKFTLRSGYRVLDDYGVVKVHFWFEEAEEDNELIQEFKRLPKPIQRRIILKDREMHNNT